MSCILICLSPVLTLSAQGERRGYFGSDAAAAGAAPVSLATALTDLVRKERLGTDDFSDAAWLRAAAKNKLAYVSHQITC